MGGRSLSRTTTLSSSPQRVDNPYTIANLQYNCKVNSFINIEDTRTVVTRMWRYAKYNIPNYTTITSIPEEHSPNSINTSLAQNWCYAFGGDIASYKDACISLTNLPDPFYDTNNATDMNFMFFGCENLTTVPNFDTSNVINMNGMFYNCFNITTVPNFDTSNVTNMCAMFYRCYNLTTIPSFNTSNVTDMSAMFSRCYLATVPNFDTSSVTNMEGMFENCTHSLTLVPNFNTSKVTNMSSMFRNCWEMTTIPNFDTSNVTDMRLMFYLCENLTTIPNFDTSNVTNMYSMFWYCNALTTMPNFDTSNVTDMNRMFQYCKNIQGNFYISSNNIIDASGLFYNTPNYTKNIYVHANTTTYNTIYANMGNNTYNSNWNAYLYTMENNYAEIPWDGAGIYRFPTNKIQLMYTDNTPISVIEVSPYTDYNLSSVITYAQDLPADIIHNGTVWGGYVGTIKFRFFKGITNMTPDIVDTI